jgi:molecular chaperone GrpE
MNDNENNPTEEELVAEEAAATDAANDLAAEDAAAADTVRINALSAALSGDMAEEEPEQVSVDDERVLELEAQIAELRDSLLRAMAETENIRKRGERQLQDAHKYAVTGFARDILSIADNLERALDAVPEERRGENEMLGMLLEGVMAVQAGFVQTMTANKIERLVPLGEAFDPNLHEAMYEIPGTDYPDGTVAQVMEPGYRLHERLLRPARVGVAKSAGGGKPADPKVNVTV